MIFHTHVTPETLNQRWPENWTKIKKKCEEKRLKRRNNNNSFGLNRQYQIGHFNQLLIVVDEVETKNRYTFHGKPTTKNKNKTLYKLSENRTIQYFPNGMRCTFEIGYMLMFHVQAFELRLNVNSEKPKWSTKSMLTFFSISHIEWFRWKMFFWLIIILGRNNNNNNE